MNTKFKILWFEDQSTWFNSTSRTFNNAYRFGTYYVGYCLGYNYQLVGHVAFENVSEASLQKTIEFPYGYVYLNYRFFS